jgi:ferredoxin-NADP reductase
MDIFVGVIIGGLIASIAPITTIIADHLRWRRETKLMYLKAERDKFELRFRETLEQLSKAMARNSYPTEMTSDIMIMLPEEVAEKYLGFLEEKDKSTSQCRHAYLNIAIVMKEFLAKIDQQIETLVAD